MRTSLFLLLCFLSSLALGAEKKKIDPASFDVQCKAASGEFTLKFRSKSGDVTEDDMQVSLNGGGKEVSLPLKADWYQTTGAIRDKGKLPGFCRVVGSEDYDYDYPAFALSPSRVLLFFKVDNRPGFSQVSLVLLDPKTMRVVDHKESIASMKERNMAFLAVKGGVE
jgi:hypothetical protein